MRSDFWRSSGYRLLRPDGPDLFLTEDFLRAFLVRPELAPVEESCAAERALHAGLLEHPLRPVNTPDLDAMADPDARANWQAFLRFRDRVWPMQTVVTAWLDLVRLGAHRIPPLFLDQLVHALARHLLDEVEDSFKARAAELLFREQRVTLQEGQIMLADEETVAMLSRGGGFGSLGRLLVEAEAPLRQVELDVLEPGNREVYWARSDRFDMVLDLGFTRPGLDALCRVLEAFVRRTVGVEVAIQPVASIRDERWVWHIGLDAASSELLNDLYQGREVSEERLHRLLALFRLEFKEPACMLERVRGRPVYLGLMAGPDQRLKVKPQNLILNLPLAHRT